MEAASSDEEWLALAQAKGITPDMLYGVDLQDEAQKKWLYEQFGYAKHIGEQIKLLGFLRQYKVKRDQGRDIRSLRLQQQNGPPRPQENSLKDGETYNLGASKKQNYVPRWGKELHQLNPVNYIFDTLSLHGRKEATDAIRGKVESLFSHEPINHGEYNVLIASGHVRAGKTRIGEEVFKIVRDIVSATENPRYVPVKLGNGNGFSQSFDPHVSSSEALGARIVKGYFDKNDLKAVNTPDVINTIAGEGKERKWPIVVHIDEHGQYASAYAKYLKQSEGEDKDDNAVFIERGRAKIAEMIDVLVSIATNKSTNQQLTLVIVLSGTSFGDISPDHESMYKLFPIKLPALNPHMCRELVFECINSRSKFITDTNRNIELPEDVRTILDSPMFKVALADTGGLPGWVVELGTLACSPTVWKTENYVNSIHNEVKRYLKKPNPQRIAASVLVGFARPPLKMSTELLRGDAQTSGRKRKRDAWTVRDASDSGSINVVESTREGSIEFMEIRIPTAVMASYESYEEVNLPYDISTLCCTISKMDPWTWQRFESAHICYLAAVLYAIAKTKERFWTCQGNKVTLSNVLVGVSPSEHQILKKVFTPQDLFDAINIVKDESQCIPRANARSKAHKVDMNDLNHMHQAKDGTRSLMLMLIRSFVMKEQQRMKLQLSSSSTSIANWSQMHR